MNWTRAFVYLIYRKRSYGKLLTPFLFLRLELFLTGLLIFKVLGIASPVVETHDKPIVLISYLHGDKLVKPFGKFSEDEQQLVIINSHQTQTLALYAVNIMFGLVGILISSLWINRFFRRNNLNPKWWIWQLACLGGHALCFSMTLFLK
ncbi:hypothetical protein RCC89_09875 [Cytophagaceae bacterium ABcell3]|nr:hypothetical protein RCC89_09875 [Cytophagaceae bacterium ABcell3]